MQPFVPSDQNLREFSLRAVLIGLVMAVVLGSANAYLGLKAGMTIAATYPAAVIGMALIKLMKGTILEENMARTVGSIGESVAAGAIFTIPAFVISGVWPRFFTAGNYVTSSLIMFAGGVLGIMFVALLRRVMVEDAELPYPESVAAAEIHKAGARGGSGTKFLFGAMGIGAAIQALVQISLFASTWEAFVAFKTTTIGLVQGWKAKVMGGMLLSSPGISPAYMGVGYIIGPRLGALNFSGGILAWGLLVPIITYFLAPGVLPEGAPQGDWIGLSYSVWKFIVRPIAIGGMLMGASYTLFKMRKSLAIVAPDARIQVILIAFSFGAFLEGVAGFGAPVALGGASGVAPGAWLMAERITQDPQDLGVVRDAEGQRIGRVMELDGSMISIEWDERPVVAADELLPST